MSSASPMHKFCVGTLVSSKYVVTAAQCVHQRLASQVFTMLGEFYLGATGETPTLEHVLTIDRIILHEFFDPATLAYDLALLELTAPVDLSVFTPACLARATDTLAGELGAQVFGWDRESLELFQAPAVAVPSSACSAAMAGALLTSGMLCARSVEGHRNQWPCQVLVFIQTVSYLLSLSSLFPDGRRGAADKQALWPPTCPHWRLQLEKQLGRLWTGEINWSENKAVNSVFIRRRMIMQCSEVSLHTGPGWSSR